MATITLYVKESDSAVIAQAKAKLGDSLSSVFVDCIREKLTMAAPEGRMEKIVLTFWKENGGPVIKKSFTGRWLVGGPDEGLRAEDDTQDWDAGAEWSAAQTQKGKLVVYLRHCNDGFAPAMEVFDTFGELKDDEIPGAGMSYPLNLIAAVAAALNQPYEIALDI